MKEHTFLINLEWIDPTFYYEELHDCISKLWKEAFHLFTNFEIIRNQRSFNISIDWSELKKVISHNLKYNISLEQYSKMHENTKAFYYEQITEDSNIVSLKCRVETTSRELDANNIAHYFELFFYELFLVMNLSGPGCCNFARTSISRADENSLAQSLNLSSHFFAHSWEIYHDDRWPVIQYIPLEISWNWYQNLNIGTKQLADTRTERAIFALLSIASNKNFNATNVIWLAHALEALYGNPKKNIKQVLIERICIFLKPEKWDIEIRQFYKYRSRFVHGELGAKNPINNSLFDENILDYDIRLINETDFSLAIVLSTIQQMILNNSYEIKFDNKVL